jgi:hypothetical protein
LIISAAGDWNCSSLLFSASFPASPFSSAPRDRIQRQKKLAAKAATTYGERSVSKLRKVGSQKKNTKKKIEEEVS